MASGHSDLPPPLPFAHQADVVRAHQKDEQCKGELRRLVLDAVEETLGGRAAAWQSTAGAVADYSYSIFTGVLAGSTLGEEYCELLSVSPGLQPSDWRRRLAAALLSMALPKFQSRLPLSLAALISVVLPLLMRFHLALFYLFGRYHHLSDRALCLRAVSMAERPYRNFSYRPLGALLLVQVLGQVLFMVLERRRSRATPANAAVSMTGIWDSSRDNSVRSAFPDQGQAPLCNICMCPSEITTATPCGHLFCWDCIASWCAMKSSCPLCRATAPPQKLLPLLHYASTRD